VKIGFARFPGNDREHPVLASWLMRQVDWCVRNGIEWADRWESGWFIDTQRNMAADWALRERCDYLVMTDCDMGFLDGLLEACVNVARENMPLVIGVPFVDAKGKMWIETAEGEIIKDDIGRHSFEAVKWIGSGFLFINVKAFRLVPAPWFKFTREPVTQGMISGEDVHFTRACVAAGVPVYVAWDYPAEHYKEVALRTPADRDWRTK
jgi:hypothetical protein